MAHTRNTTQLTAVREALYALANHPTADEVYEYVHAQHPSISRATVYRTLNKLADQGEAIKVPTSYGADRFDHTCTHHAHVQCSACGTISDIAIDVNSYTIANAEKQSGFCIDACKTQFLGLCPACAKLQQKN